MATRHARTGIAHPTVVPENYDPDEEADDEDAGDASADADADGDADAEADAAADIERGEATPWNGASSERD